MPTARTDPARTDPALVVPIRPTGRGDRLIGR